MKIINELYIIPDKNEFIIYAPLKRKILLVNEDLIRILLRIRNGEKNPNNEATNKCLEYLEKNGIINTIEEYPDGTSQIPAYYPTSVTFLPTTDCNLKCIYCYANSGERNNNLSINIATKAIDYIAINSARNKNRILQVGFLGGGEPFLRWNFVKSTIEYAHIVAKKNNLKTYFTGVTNGILSDNKIDFIINNFNYLNISLDGTKEINDQHRLFRDSSSSFENVIYTIKKLKDVNFSFAIRATISSLNVNEMESITRYYCNELGVKRIHFEPLSACGRAKSKSELVPDLNQFVSNFKKCIKLSSKYKAELFCSAIRLDILTSRFCGALDQNFYVVPGGYITACTEVSSIKDPLSKIFFIGKFNKESNSFDIWNDKRNLLADRTVDKIEDCSNCLSKWHCAGACPVKSAMKGDINKPSNLINCDISKELTQHYIKLIAHGKKGLVPRIKELSQI